MGITAVTLFTTAGAVLAIFVLVVFGARMMSLWQTQCWTDTVNPFNDKLLYGSMAEPGLGNMDNFKIKLYLNDQCLYAIYFIKRDTPSQCSTACTQSGLDSSTVNWCQEECFKKCGKDNGDCIVLIPKKTKWYDVVGWFSTRNKPVIFSSGKYKLNMEARWWGLQGGIYPNYEEKCITFSRSKDKDTYDATPTNKESDCSG